jgi:hypothetical protein
MCLPRMSTDLIRTMGRREHYPSPDQSLPLRIGYSAPAFGRRFLFVEGACPIRSERHSRARLSP